MTSGVPAGTVDATGIVAAVEATVPPGAAIVALSGGADSAVVAWALRQGRGRDVRAVHVHHGLPASDALAAAAKQVAAAVGLPLITIAVEIPSGPSQEGQARTARLQALEADGGAGEWIVTGHHADDVVETVIGNLMRGAGATGLSGMQARRGRWVRPLLAIPRAAVRRLADDLALPYADDPANLDRRHRRNVIRHDVIPVLEDRLPGHDVRAAVARSAAALAADDAVLEAKAATLPLRISDGAVVVPAAVLATADAAVAARMARRALRRARPPHAGSAADVDAVVAVAAGTRRRVALAAGWYAEREGPLVALYRTEPVGPSGSVPLEPDATVGFGDFEISLQADPPSRYRPVGRWRVLLSQDAIGSHLVVRVVEPGERIDLGGGSKLVRDAMAEAGIPRRLRAAWPVVAAPARIAWLVGARTAAWARADAAATGNRVELSATKGTTP